MKIHRSLSAVAVLLAVSTTTLVRAQQNFNCNSQPSPCVEAENSSSGGIGIIANGNFYGITGTGLSSTGAGVYGYSQGSGANGVQGASTAYNGVQGSSGASGASGVYGVNSNNGYGVAGRISPAGAGWAVYGDNVSTTGWSGYFTGRVYAGVGLNVGGNCVSGNCSSDIRLKKNVQPLVGALDELVKLRPVTFEWKNPNGVDRTSGTQMGFIAQEVEKVKPEWVGTDDQGFKTINMNRLPVMLVESVRTLKTENDDLRERVKALEANRRPLSSGFGEGGLGLGLGLLAVAGALVMTRRKQSDLAD